MIPFISVLVAVAAYQTPHLSLNYTPIVPPVLLDIAQCESGQQQFDDDGKIIKHKNKDGSIDYGYFQINSSHIKHAKSLGFDIFTPEGNVGYALWLYNASSTIPWNSSKSCWKHSNSG